MNDAQNDTNNQPPDKFAKRIELIIKLVVAIGTVVIGIIELVKLFKT